MNTENVSDYYGSVRYFPALNMCTAKLRFTRKVTLDGGSGTDYKLASIPEQYADVVATPLRVYAAIGNPDAGLYGYINTYGEISIRMIDSTNPTYYYLGGTWFVD